MQGTAARLEAMGIRIDGSGRIGGAGLFQQNVIEGIWEVLSGGKHLNSGRSSIQTLKKWSIPLSIGNSRFTTRRNPRPRLRAVHGKAQLKFWLDVFPRRVRETCSLISILILKCACSFHVRQLWLLLPFYGLRKKKVLKQKIRERCVMSGQNQPRCGFSFPWDRRNNGHSSWFAGMCHNNQPGARLPQRVLRLAGTCGFKDSLTRGSRAIQSEQGVQKTTISPKKEF